MSFHFNSENVTNSCRAQFLIRDHSQFLALFRMSDSSNDFSTSQEKKSQCSEFDQIPAPSCLLHSHWSTNPYFAHSDMETAAEDGLYDFFLSFNIRASLISNMLWTYYYCVQCSVSFLSDWAKVAKKKLSPLIFVLFLFYRRSWTWSRR